MNHLAVAKLAVTVAPFVAAAIAAALTVRTSYDAQADELTIRVRKVRPAVAAITTLRAGAR